MLNCGSPVIFDLHPGDLLFVPGGSPHAVINTSVTVAIAGNFVDSSNLNAVLSDLKQTRHRYADDAALYEALDEIEFDEEDYELDQPLLMDPK